MKIYSTKNNEEIKNNLLIQNPKIKQYPDFMILENGIYHIVDAKYKLKNSLFKSRDIFWQILIYAKLFNKNNDIKQVKKVIIYPDILELDILRDFELKLNYKKLDINNYNQILKENVFDSEIGLIGIGVFEKWYN